MTEPKDTAWGHSARHYGATLVEAARAAARADEEASGRWAEALEHASPGIRKSVEGASKQWSTVLCDHLRGETGLKISVAGDSKAVPVKVFDGMTKPFAGAIGRHRFGIHGRKGQ